MAELDAKACDKLLQRDTVTAMYDVLGKADALCRVVGRPGNDLNNEIVHKMLREGAAELKAAVAIARDGMNGRRNGSAISQKWMRST